MIIVSRSRSPMETYGVERTVTRKQGKGAVPLWMHGMGWIVEEGKGCGIL